jgi:GTP cyclohydrolase FolE2
LIPAAPAPQGRRTPVGYNRPRSPFAKPMNFPDLKLMPDVQSSPDSRRLAIDRVGIRGLKYPMQVVDVDGSAQGTVVEADLSVELDAAVKGTHMSRFIGLLEGRDGVLSLERFRSLLRDMVALLHARARTIEIPFP